MRKFLVLLAVVAASLIAVPAAQAAKPNLRLAGSCAASSRSGSDTRLR